MTDIGTLLRIDATGRDDDSVSKPLADRLVTGIRKAHPKAALVTRDLVADPVPPVGPAWIDAAFAGDDRTPTQIETLAPSNVLVDEFAAADALVITAPIYNFSIPAALKLWIDQVARIGRTFRYTEDGPVPLLPDRPTYVVVASGGTEIGSEIDFATGYLRHVLGFLGLTSVTIVAADRLMFEAEAKLAAANAQIDAIARDAAAGRLWVA